MRKESSRIELKLLKYMYLFQRWDTKAIRCNFTFRDTENDKIPCSEFLNIITLCHMSHVLSVKWPGCIEGIYLLWEEQGEATFICSWSKHLLRAFHTGNEDSKSNHSCSMEILNFLWILKDLFRNKRFIWSRKIHMWEYTKNSQGKMGCSVSL